MILFRISVWSEVIYSTMKGLTRTARAESIAGNCRRLVNRGRGQFPERDDDRSRGRDQCPERADDRSRGAGSVSGFGTSWQQVGNATDSVKRSAPRWNGLTDRQRWVSLVRFGSWLNGSESPELFVIDVEPLNVSWSCTKAGRLRMTQQF